MPTVIVSHIPAFYVSKLLCCQLFFSACVFQCFLLISAACYRYAIVSICLCSKFGLKLWSHQNKDFYLCPNVVTVTLKLSFKTNENEPSTIVINCHHFFSCYCLYLITFMVSDTNASYICACIVPGERFVTTVPSLTTGGNLHHPSTPPSTREMLVLPQVYGTQKTPVTPFERNLANISTQKQFCGLKIKLIGIIDN